jgi:methylmalonyl-CoA/ethylmalonyl-CoA epimerase
MLVEDKIFAGSFHHLGIACRNISTEANVWSELGYSKEGEAFDDDLQGIKGLFMVGPGPRIELLEDLPGRKTIAPWLNRGIKIYHTAFEVFSFDDQINILIGSGARVVVPPCPAVAFANRRICFLLLRNISLIELIDSGNQENL